MVKGKFRILSDGMLMFWCPGCNGYHGLYTQSDKTPRWNFNGDYNKPTLTPSIHVIIPGKICHSFITDGMIQFLDDSCHKLAGKTVELPDIEAMEG